MSAKSKLPKKALKLIDLIFIAKSTGFLLCYECPLHKTLTQVGKFMIACCAKPSPIHCNELEVQCVSI